MPKSCPGARFPARKRFCVPWSIMFLFDFQNGTHQYWASVFFVRRRCPASTKRMRWAGACAWRNFGAKPYNRLSCVRSRVPERESRRAECFNPPRRLYNKGAAAPKTSPLSPRGLPLLKRRSRLLRGSLESGRVRGGRFSIVCRSCFRPSAVPVGPKVSPVNKF